MIASTRWIDKVLLREREQEGIDSIVTRLLIKYKNNNHDEQTIFSSTWEKCETDK